MDHRLLLTGLLLTCGPGLVAAAEPNITLEEDTWDFGEVAQGQKLSHEMKISNGGDGPLVISMVKTSCSVCSGAMVGSRVIPAGRSSTLKIEFHTVRLTGRQRKSLTIHSNDPDEPFKRIWITGTVVKKARAIVEVTPSLLERRAPCECRSTAPR